YLRIVLTDLKNAFRARMTPYVVIGSKAIDRDRARGTTGNKRTQGIPYSAQAKGWLLARWNPPVSMVPRSFLRRPRRRVRKPFPNLKLRNILLSSEGQLVETRTRRVREIYEIRTVPREATMEDVTCVA